MSGVLQQAHTFIGHEKRDRYAVAHVAHPFKMERARDVDVDPGDTCAAARGQLIAVPIRRVVSGGKRRDQSA